jgi:hypothetical protein
MDFIALHQARVGSRTTSDHVRTKCRPDQSPCVARRAPGLWPKKRPAGPAEGLRKVEGSPAARFLAQARKSWHVPKRSSTTLGARHEVFADRQGGPQRSQERWNGGTGPRLPARSHCFLRFVSAGGRTGLTGLTRTECANCCDAAASNCMRRVSALDLGALAKGVDVGQAQADTLGHPIVCR